MRRPCGRTSPGGLIISYSRTTSVNVVEVDKGGSRPCSSAKEILPSAAITVTAAVVNDMPKQTDVVKPKA